MKSKFPEANSFGFIIYEILLWDLKIYEIFSISSEFVCILFCILAFYVIDDVKAQGKLKLFGFGKVRNVK